MENDDGVKNRLQSDVPVNLLSIEGNFKPSGAALPIPDNVPYLTIKFHSSLMELCVFSLPETPEEQSLHE